MYKYCICASVYLYIYVHIYTHTYKFKLKMIGSSFIHLIRTDYTEWSKPERKTPIQYTNAYIWNLERW